MFDWPGIYVRFFAASEARHSSHLARIYGVGRQSSHSWKSGKSHVPWRKMKQLVDEKDISWDWLIEGKGPKYSKHRRTKTGEFDWAGIGKRFFSLFPNKPQTAIAQEMGVSQVTVSKWYRGEKHVPWNKLSQLVKMHRVTWNWILEGS